MNVADVIVVSIIVISAVISLFRGFVREILSLVAWVVAFWCAFSFAEQAATLLTAYVSVATVRLVLAFISILVVALILTGLVNYLIGRLIDETGLSGTDRVLGALFGVLRGVAIVAIGVFVAGLTPLPGKPWWQESQTLVPFETLALRGVSWLPPDLSKHFSY